MTQAPKEKPAGPVRTGATGNDLQRPKHSTTGPDGKARFDREQLDSMRHRLPEYLTARGVELRPQGARLVGKCPNHDDGNPSFALWGERHEFCGCFPCSFQGDIFATAEWLGRAGSFPEAVADVAAVLGVTLPQGHAPSPSRPAQAQQRPAPQAVPPFTLNEADTEKLHTARLQFSDAYDGGELDTLAGGLGIPLWAFRWCAKGRCGLGWWHGRLAYIYPQGMKLRNPPGMTPRFVWECGRATQPWRMEFATKPEVRTVYLSEGESDCISLVAAGLETDGAAACVASPGTSFVREWVPLFAGRRVVLCFDRDKAGQDATAAVAAMLRGTASEISTWKGPKQ
jgi:hypothetical protein